MSGRAFDGDLLDAGGLLRRGHSYFIANGGKVIAIVTLAVAALVTFANVTLDGWRADNFATTLATMLIASYLMYFSLEDAGERLGEECEWYKSAAERYKAARAKIRPSDIPALREFCTRYSHDELEYRRIALITEAGYAREEYEAYRASGRCENRRASRTFRKAERLRAVTLTPHILLSFERSAFRSELVNPEKYKLPWLVLQLIPSTLCMTFTVSVMLTMKDGLTASTVIDGIVKLTALPLVGFRGYSEGYSYIKNGKSVWLETKARLLETYLTEGEG